MRSIKMKLPFGVLRGQIVSPLASRCLLTSVCLVTALVLFEVPSIAQDQPDTGQQANLPSLPMPGAVSEIALASSGEQLVVHIPEAGGLFTVDLASREIVAAKRISSAIQFAASARHVVVYDEDSMTLSRYQLSTLRREQTIVLDQPVVGIALGNASFGPLALLGSDGVLEIHDLHSLERVASVSVRPRGIRTLNPVVLASADGQVFTVSDGSSIVVRNQANDWVRAGEVNQTLLIPGVGGELYTTPGGLLDDQLGPGSYPEGRDSAWRIPSTKGPTSLTLREFEVDGDLTVRAEVRHPAMAKPLASVALKGLAFSGSVARVPIVRNDRRPRWIIHQAIHDSSGHQIVFLDANATRLYFAELPPNRLPADEQHVIDMTVVPAYAVAGKSVSYKLDVLATRPEMEYELLSGPPGLSVDENGTVAWNVPKSATEYTTQAIVSIRNGAQSDAFHRLSLRVLPRDPQQSFDLASPKVDSKPLPKWARGKAGGSLASEPVKSRSVALPAPMDHVCVGGGGRYLVLRLPSIRRAVVVDVQAAKLSKVIPIPVDAMIAAGMTKFVILSPEQGTVQRWDFGTLEKEQQSRVLGIRRTVSIAMGCGSEGPILLAQDDRATPFAWMELATLKSHYLSAGKSRQRGRPGSLRDAHVRVSGNGRTLAIWRRKTSPSGVYLVDIRDRGFEIGYRHESAGYLVPDARGTRIYSPTGIFSIDGTLIGGRRARLSDGYPVPAVSGDLVVRLQRAERGLLDENDNRPSVSIHVGSQRQALMRLENVDVRFGNDSDLRSVSDITIDERIHYAPHLNRLVTLPESNDSVVIRNVDLDQMIEKSTTGDLLVLSTPPSELVEGNRLAYQIDARSSRDDLRFELIRGPSDLTITPSGQLDWVAQIGANAQKPAVVLIRDGGGNEVLHRVPLNVIARSSFSEPATSPSGTEMRQWRDQSGFYQIRAQYIRSDATHIYLLRDDGKEIVIDRHMLSIDDRAYVSRLNEQ